MGNSMELSQKKKKKAKTKLLYGRACPLLGLYLEKTKTLIPKDTFIPIFMPELFDSQDIETYSFYLWDKIPIWKMSSLYQKKSNSYHHRLEVGPENFV